MSDIAADKAIAADFFSIFSSGDMDAVVAMLDDQASWWVAGRLAGVSGRYSKAEIGPLLKGSNALYKAPGLRITPVSMVAEDDEVAIEAEGFAILLDDRLYEPSYHFRLSIRDGRVAEVREYMDTHLAWEMFLQT